MAVSNIVIIFIVLANVFVKGQRSNEAIDTGFIESVLDAEQCDQQINIIKGNVLLGMQFVDAGIRLPKGILQGGLIDLGNYHQCLAVDHLRDDMDIQGKYCQISVPIGEATEILNIDDPLHRWRFNMSLLNLDKETIDMIEKYDIMRAKILALSGDLNYLKQYQNRIISDNPLFGLDFNLGVCIPKSCTTEQAITSLLFNFTAVGINVNENYCRLRGDKPWSNADIVAVVILSLLGLVTLLSTCYDMVHRLVLKSDIKTINPILQSFSVYKNGQRIITFNSGSGNLQCIDGIRTLGMMWVIVGHTFATEPFFANPLDSFKWMISANSLWITAAPMTVDTFFTLSGILVVYTVAGKMSGKTLLKNLHLFYLSRIIRITPLLAVTVLLQASFFNHIADGPYWQTVAADTNKCRNYWWYTLLHIQNFFDPDYTCLGHSWYIAIDVQMYFVSPLVIFWILTGKRRQAWSALIAALVIVLIASTIFNFQNNLQAGIMVPSRGEDASDYWPRYYLHPLTRAAPFFVGLIFGYLLHICRDKKIHMPWVAAALSWICSFAIFSAIFYFKYRILQLDWDNQFMDNFMNSFMRPAWASVIGWIIFACVHGYGGLVNWFLTLDMWRLPARLTYGMYLLHYPFMYSINGTMVTPYYFSAGGLAFKFLSYFVLAMIASYVVTILVESPISTLYKQLMIKVQPRKAASNETTAVKRDHCNKGTDFNGVQINADDETETQRKNTQPEKMRK